MIDRTVFSAINAFDDGDFEDMRRIREARASAERQKQKNVSWGGYDLPWEDFPWGTWETPDHRQIDLAFLKKAPEIILVETERQIRMYLIKHMFDLERKLKIKFTNRDIVLEEHRIAMEKIYKLKECTNGKSN
jgi:hypothetical protein